MQNSANDRRASHPARAARFAGIALCAALVILPGRQFARAETAGIQLSERAILLPEGDLYPQYAADPHRAGFGIKQLRYLRTGITDAGDDRVELRAGGRFGIVRLHPSQRSDQGWQVSVEGGYNGQFDADHSLDNIGWDGRYGLVVSAAPGNNVAFRLAALHDSSHVGDEYAERTGRRRIGYTRHELAAGASWVLGAVRLYTEAARAYQMSSGLQEPGRFQAGAEYGTLAAAVAAAQGWYGAVDISSLEERDWKLDVAVQAGYGLRSGARIWRIGLEWYQGRPPLGEFFQATERSVGLGIWIDL